MAIPTTGAIGVSQHLNRELGRGINSTFSIDTAENGGYGTINTNSSSRPNSSNPASFSEWRGYDHDAGGGGTPITRLNLGYSVNQTFQGGVDACLGNDMALVYSFDGAAWWTDTLYESRNGPLGRRARRGTYSDQPSGGFTYGYWSGTGWTLTALCVI